jgi:hypothetical protein
MVLSLAGLLAACAAAPLPQSTQPAPTTPGQVLAQAACPHRIAEASAWVNHMPGTGRNPRTLNIDIRLVEPTDTAILLKSTATRGDTLVLEIRSAQTSSIPGRLAYREPVPDPLYKRISFFCRGGEVFSLTDIQKVY